MNARRTLACLFAILLMAPGNLFAQEATEDSREGAIRHSVRIGVMLVESSGDLNRELRDGLSGKTDSVKDAIQKITNEGVAQVVNQAELTVIEEQETMLQIGETVAVVSGSSRISGGRVINNYNMMQVGTILSVTSKVMGDQVLVDLDFTKSFLTPKSDDDPDRPQGTATLTHQSTMRIKDGHSQLVGRMMSRESADQVQAYQLIVAVDVLSSGSDSATTRFQTFSAPMARRGVAPAGRGDARRPIPARPDARSPSRRDSARPSFSARSTPIEARRRFAAMIFERADQNSDNVITEDELAQLRVKDDDAELPITREQYLTWMEENWPPRPPASSARPGTQTRVRPARPTEDVEKSDKDDDDDEIEDEEDENEEDDDDDEKEDE